MLQTSSYRPGARSRVTQPTVPALMPSPDPAAHEDDASPRLSFSSALPPSALGTRCPATRPGASGSTTISWVRQPRLPTTKLTFPAGTVAGTARNIMWEPIGAMPYIMGVIPMSPSITDTVVPASDDGAEHVSRDMW